MMPVVDVCKTFGCGFIWFQIIEHNRQELNLKGMPRQSLSVTLLHTFAKSHSRIAQLAEPIIICLPSGENVMKMTAGYSR
jgi:hypothetical protein